MGTWVKRPSPAMIVAIIALIAALTGTAFAALGKNTVGSKQLKKNAVTTTKIKAKAVTEAKLKANAVTNAKIANDAVTGDKVKESTLGAVPNATNAVNAVNAANAAGFSGYVAFGITVLNSGESRTLVSNGPFSLIGRCAVDGANLEANVVFATTEDHTSFGGDDSNEGDVGPTTPEAQRIIEDPGASSAGPAENSEGYDDQFNAQSLSGSSWAGTVESWVSKDIGQCRWSGYILKTS